jgi:SH3-like domain-containing protein
MKRRLIIFTLLMLMVPSSALAERLAVASNISNIRSGPGTQYDVIWQVEKYYPVDVIRKTGEWVLFRDFEGDEGWIHQSLLDNTVTVVIKKDQCNIRSGPGADYPTLFRGDKGIPFKVLGKKGDWLQIKHADGDRGWIHKALVW